MTAREFKFYHADRLGTLSESMQVSEQGDLSRFGLFYTPAFNIPNPIDNLEGAARREYLLEVIRQQKFPNQPSRLSCMFGANSILEAECFAKSIVPIPKGSVRIFEVYASSFVTLDSTWLDYRMDDMPTKINYYEQYWWAGISNSAPTVGERKPPTLEVLMRLPVRTGNIVSVVDLI